MAPPLLPVPPVAVTGVPPLPLPPPPPPYACRNPVLMLPLAEMERLPAAPAATTSGITTTTTVAGYVDVADRNATSGRGNRKL